MLSSSSGRSPAPPAPLARSNALGTSLAAPSSSPRLAVKQRAWVAVGTTGIAERALDLAIGWAKERKQFGQPIGSFQLIQVSNDVAYMDIVA